MADAPGCGSCDGDESNDRELVPDGRRVSPGAADAVGLDSGTPDGPGAPDAPGSPDASGDVPGDVPGDVSSVGVGRIVASADPASVETGATTRPPSSGFHVRLAVSYVIEPDQ